MQSPACETSSAVPPAPCRKRSLVPHDLNLSLNNFVWHDYDAMLQRLGFNGAVGGMILSDFVDYLQNGKWWRCY